ncbi:hypothetical protein Hanom_Chr16g01431521 [Helianthus anomalus]
MDFFTAIEAFSHNQMTNFLNTLFVNESELYQKVAAYQIHGLSCLLNRLKSITIHKDLGLFISTGFSSSGFPFQNRTGNWKHNQEEESINGVFEFRSPPTFVS